MRESQLTRLGLFDSKVPRYTSYPPATRFTDKVGAPQFAEWLSCLPGGSEISLYVHIPFCRRLCWFCACRTQGTLTDAPVRSYAETLLAEIAMLRALVPDGVRLSRLHWGGGTPTLLSPPLIRRLADTILAHFPAAPGMEFSVEIDPNEIDEPRMDALAEAGLNRASIGVQDFDEQIQAVIGREQSYAITARAAEMIRARGIASLNADILYGLPGQDNRSIADSVQKLLALGPDRIALYGYAHVPWMARRQNLIPEDALPSPQARLALFETARELFVADGYDEIGIDHFARPRDGLAVAQQAGRLRRNFQGYTDDQAVALIGVGASSISRLPQGYAQNAPATGAHLAAIREGRLSVLRGHAFTAEDRWRSRVIEAILCDFRVDATEMQRDFGLSADTLAALFRPVAERFEGLPVIEADGSLTIPQAARPLARMVARAFDAYEMDSTRHSSAI